MLQRSPFPGQELRPRCREQSCVYCQGRREGESGTNWESRVDINTLPFVEQIASRNLMYIAQGAQLGAL